MRPICAAKRRPTDQITRHSPGRTVRSPARRVHRAHARMVSPPMRKRIHASRRGGASASATLTAIGLPPQSAARNNEMRAPLASSERSEDINLRGSDIQALRVVRISPRFASGFTRGSPRARPDGPGASRGDTRHGTVERRKGNTAVNVDAVRGITVGILVGLAAWGGLLCLVWLVWRLLVRFA
jgi:hypothetical protein